MRYLGKFKLSEDEIGRAWRLENGRRVAVRRSSKNRSLSTEMFARKIFERTQLNGACALTAFRKTGEKYYPFLNHDQCHSF